MTDEGMRFVGARELPELNLARTTCACGSTEPHPDQHWIVLVGGPFENPEAAMNALANVVKTKSDVLRANKSLHRPLNGKDITGGA